VKRLAATKTLKPQEDKSKEEKAHQGREEGDGVLGAEGDKAAGSPRDVVHHAVAAGAYEDPLHLHSASPGPAVSTSMFHGCRRHHKRSPAPSGGGDSVVRRGLE
jgi:hypothetical protein